ncbi:uncharacterized protein LOC119647800 isoform X2 [Hermetia illucens]|uniref:uncharacterized protein LOC119647800 isoform X2 n=1 Tax=Hermetia illucens TaxID=343691 RepID=UPI0018CC4858|nr:uncharacterized protein LOC119647800 isoform X2 [Hermetia illucens]
MLQTYFRRDAKYDFASNNVVLCKLKSDTLLLKEYITNFLVNNKTLYVLIIYYCCVLVTTTPAVASEHNKFFIRLGNIENFSDNEISKREHYVFIFNESFYVDAKRSLRPQSSPVQRRQIVDSLNMPSEGDEYESEEFTEEDVNLNATSAKGLHVGALCEGACSIKLHHVNCDPITKTCSCDRNHPVLLGLFKGCGKPKQLGEQCFYHQTCKYNDENSLCVQVSHNALCQCAPGYHSVTYTKPMKRVFCTEDLAVITSDLPTLLGVTTGIAVLAGLICMVLHLFSKTKYPRHRNLADANIPPPIMYSSDTAQSARPSSRSSLHSSGSIGSYGNRRPSSAPQSGSKGVLVSTSRTGSRRPSLASVHSTSSSIRSYGVMRFEKEAQQKEIRQEMKLRLTRLQQQQYCTRPQIIVGGTGSHGAITKMIMPTTSPLTPNSLDELLPSVDESQEIFIPKIENDISNNIAYQGPCSSSSEVI